MFRSLHDPVEIIVQHLGMVIILIQVILFSHLKLESIVRALQDLVEIGGRPLLDALK